MGTWAIELFDPLFKTAVSLGQALEDLINPYVKTHKDNHDDDENKDFMDSYLKEILRCQDKTSSFYGKRGEESLMASIMDLFLGGIETTAATLSWGILYMLHNPEVQKKVQNELDMVLDPQRQVTQDYKSRLPYTCAVINEIYRHSTIFPTVTRTTTSPIKINGFIIPQGALVIGNLIGIHQDSRIWKHPAKFDPSRFIDQVDGSCKGSDNLVTFSVGKRSCAGQTLAEKELYLFFVGLLRAFELKPVPGRELPNCDVGKAVKVIKSAPPYEVILEKRH